MITVVFQLLTIFYVELMIRLEDLRTVNHAPHPLRKLVLELRIQSKSLEVLSPRYVSVVSGLNWNRCKVLACATK